jgi:CheY-like chemotaxis protein
MPKKILIADQSETVREIAESLFRKNGLEVMSAADGLDAIELLGSARPDVAFLDSNLPEIDGFRVSRQIKSVENLSRIKIVLMLSTSEIVEQSKLTSSLADDTMNKPFSPQQLLDKTSEVLGERVGSSKGEDGAEKDGEDTIESEEMGFNDTEDEEIDFGSIFGEENESLTDDEIDEVFLGEEINAPASRDSSTEVELTDDMDEVTDVVADSAKNSSESEISIAKDQYGLEGPLDDTEIERPHDYNWFIREMKKDLDGSGSSEKASQKTTGKKAQPGPAGDVSASKRDKGTDSLPGAESFHIEEMGMSRLMTKADDEEGTHQAASVKSTPKAASNAGQDAKLTLAEKLLLQEIAKRLADRMLQKYSSRELREMLSEILSNLSKM